MIDVAEPSQLLSLYAFNTHFRLAAYERTLPLLSSAPDLAGDVRSAIAYDERTRQLENERAKQVATPDGNPEAVQLDREVDRAVSGIPSAIEAFITARPVGDARAVAAQDFLNQTLPLGLAAVVHANFVEEASTAKGILERFRRAPDSVKEFGLAATQARLEELLPKYQAALAKSQSGLISYDELRAEQNAGLQRFALIVIRLMAQHPQFTPEAAAARRKLLAPLLELNDQLGEMYRRTRSGPASNDATPAAPAAPTPT